MTSADDPGLYNLEAEQAVLGAILVEPDRFDDLAGRLAPADFFRDAHRVIFQQIQELAAEQRALDPLVLKDRLELRGLMDRIGGPVYFFGLSDGVPKSTNVAAYARIVTERAERRRLQAAARRIVVDAADLTQDTRTVLDSAEQAIFAVADARAGADFTDAPALVGDCVARLDQLREAKRGVTGVPTGFADLDHMTRGLQPDSLVLIAARPSMGKTSLSSNIASYAARHEYHVGFFSLEMSKDEMFMRLVAAESRIDGHRLQTGCINQSDFSRLSDTLNALRASHLHVDDSATLSVLELRGKARRLLARAGLDLVIVDYLQLMQVGKAENRNLAIAEVSRSLKQLARELHVPVVALSQLSREAERRNGKPPMLSDLRDSGALEQDADLVLFIHRPEVYQRTAENSGLAEIVIAKQRNGPTGTVRLRWSAEHVRFDDLGGSYA